MTSTKTKTSSSLFQAKSFPINKPPFFARSDYQFWKKKITWYLQSLDLEVWKTILFGYTFLPKVVDGNKIQKPLKEYDEEENNEFQLNSRAIYILLCAMDRTEYNRICQCKTAKDVWRILEITHEGTNQVKDFKVRILVNDYEMFKMKPNKSIVEMFIRFTDIVNGLEGLGNRVSEEDKVSKILRCLEIG